MVKTEQFVVGKYIDLNTYSFELPNIYQIELVGGLCNLKCPLCPVTLGKVYRKEKFFNVEFLKNMIDNNYFKNTFYTELQMYGEPCLHPKLNKAIKILKNENLKIGLSTNLTIWRNCLLDLDFITISADSILYRKERNDSTFLKNFKKILKSDVKIDIQIIKVGDWKYQLDKLQNIVRNYDKSVLIRVVPNCFVSERKTNIKDFCVNPFIACSIQSDGDIVPCCFEWGKELVIGNIYTKNLSEIWHGKSRKKLIKLWISNNLPKKCSSCKFRSPILLHWRFWESWIKRGWL